MEKLVRKISFMLFIIIFFTSSTFFVYASNNVEVENGETSNIENIEESNTENTEKNSNTSTNTSNTINTETSKGEETTPKEILEKVLVDGEEVTAGSTINTNSNSVVVRTNIAMYYIKVNGKTSSSNVNLSDGKNTIEVSDSYDNKITIYINKEEEIEEVTNTEEENIEEETKINETQNEEFGLKSLKIEGWDFSPAFKNNIYTYKLNVKDINTIKIVAEANDNNASIEILGNENLKEGENVVNILVESKDKEDIKTYQIIVNKTTESLLVEGNMVQKVIVGIATGIIVLIIIIVIIKKNKNRYYFDEDDYIIENKKTKQYNAKDKTRSNKGKRFKGKH